MQAQEDSYSQALTEVRHGEKKSHWMWYVFPQMVGLGSSEMAKHYAIHSTSQARAYLAHPILGSRYREIVGALQDLDDADPVQVFGTIDARKLRSSLTLFAAASDDLSIGAALQRWFGSPDPATLAIIS